MSTRELAVKPSYPSLQLERQVDTILRMELENLKDQLVGDKGEKKGKGKKGGKKGKAKKGKKGAKGSKTKDAEAAGTGVDPAILRKQAEETERKRFTEMIAKGILKKVRMCPLPVAKSQALTVGCTPARMEQVPSGRVSDFLGNYDHCAKLMEDVARIKAAKQLAARGGDGEEDGGKKAGKKGKGGKKGAAACGIASSPSCSHCVSFLLHRPAAGKKSNKPDAPKLVGADFTDSHPVGKQILEDQQKVWDEAEPELSRPSLAQVREVRGQGAIAESAVDLPLDADSRLR